MQHIHSFIHWFHLPIFVHRIVSIHSFNRLLSPPFFSFFFVFYLFVILFSVIIFVFVFHFIIPLWDLTQEIQIINICWWLLVLLVLLLFSFVPLYLFCCCCCCFFLFNFTRLFYNSCYLEVLILPLLYLKQEPGQPTITTNLLKPHLILIIWLYRIEFLLYRRLFVCLCAYFIENIGIIFLVFFSSFILWLLFAESMHEIWNNCIQIYLFMPVKSIIFYHKH